MHSQITNRTYEVLLIVLLAFDSLINFQNVALAHQWIMILLVVLDINLWIYFFQKHPNLQRLVFIWSSLMLTIKILALIFKPHYSAFKTVVEILDAAAMFYICRGSRKYIKLYK